MRLHLFAVSLPKLWNLISISILVTQCLTCLTTKVPQTLLLETKCHGYNHLCRGILSFNQITSSHNTHFSHGSQWKCNRKVIGITYYILGKTITITYYFQFSRRLLLITFYYCNWLHITYYFSITYYLLPQACISRPIKIGLKFVPCPVMSASMPRLRPVFY